MENYVINELISWRLIDGQILILDSHLNESAHELNEIGSFIFEQISLGSPLNTIRNSLHDQYPNSQQEIEKDLSEFIKHLSELKLIVPQEKK